MKVTSKALALGIAAFLSKDLKPKYPSASVGKFLMGFSAGVIRRRAEIIGKRLLSFPLIAICVLEDDETIDLDMLIEVAREELPECGLDLNIPLCGDITLRKSDTDILRQYVENESG